MGPGEQSADRGRRLLRRRGGPGSEPSPSHPDTERLAESPLFDEHWYADTTRFRGSRAEAIADYLGRPVGKRPSPHPMFDRAYVERELAESLGRDLTGRDAFLVYLRRRPKRISTHPLFDVRGYLRQSEDARQHSRGPVAHYLETGAAAGLRANDWLDPDGSRLDAWLRERHHEWRRRQDLALPQAVGERFLEDTPTPSPSSSTEVTVLLEPGTRQERLDDTIASLAAQTHRNWHALVLDTGRIAGLDTALAALVDGSWTRLEVDPLSRPLALAQAFAAAEGEVVAFLHNGDVWPPERLQRLLAFRTDTGARVVCDVLEHAGDGPVTRRGRGIPPGQTRAHDMVDLARVLVDRAELDRAGPPEPERGGAWEFDLVSRWALRAGVRALRTVGVRRDGWAARSAVALPAPERPRIPPAKVPSWAHACLNDRLIDWGALERSERVPGLVSVVILTYHDWAMTVSAVESVVETTSDGPPVEVVVLDNGSSPHVASILASLPERFDNVSVVHEPVNHGFALGNNLALQHTHGDVLVLLNNDTVVRPGWLTPLTAALAEPDVIGAQPLLIYESGTIQCAGIAFPQHGGIPYPFLQGFPVEDAEGLEHARFTAVTGAALALRFEDLVAMRGFDPIYLNGMEDVDLCLRLARHRGGSYVVRPNALVEHHESRTPGRLAHFAINRHLYLERWGHQTGDDVALWADRGFTVDGHTLRPGRKLHPAIGDLDPMFSRRRPLDVREATPRLRWAIKNPAPAGTSGDLWGDTHFADALAEGLRSRGQEVVVDRRPGHERRSGRLDDVALVLRGLAPYRPSFEQVSIGWLISHPELLAMAEAAAYDRLVAASELWAERQSEAWSLRIEPLLQATDPRRFHPDVAVPDTGHPVLFVGSSRKILRPIVGAAVEAGLPLSVYGRNWRGFVPRRFVKADYLPNEQLAAAYRSAGVVLNDHWEDMRRDGFVSNRLFDAAAAGARVVTDDLAGLPAAFGDSVQVLRDREDLVRWSSMADPDPVFGSDEARREVAARVHREHSFEVRAKRLVEIALEARRARGFDS